MISKRNVIAVLTILVTAAVPAAVLGQAFQPPPPMLAPPPVQQGQQPAQGQQPSEYAFRPDLTNPQFGECLQLEKNWKMLWQHYAQEYQRVQMINPRDPQYAQVTYYMRGLKGQLDAAWQNFSSRCVYFPRRR